jgi:hypothetical protein
LITGTKNFKLTEDGRAKLGDWQMDERDNRNAEADASDRHYELVREAVEQGKQVPENVVGEYETLVPLATPKPATPLKARPLEVVEREIEDNNARIMVIGEALRDIKEGSAQANAQFVKQLRAEEATRRKTVKDLQAERSALRNQPTPKLAAGVKQGDMIASTQTEDFALVGEQGTDGAKAEAEKAAAAKAKAEAQALQDKQQLGLFTPREEQAKMDALTEASSPLQQTGQKALDFLDKLDKQINQGPFSDPLFLVPIAKLALKLAKAFVANGMKLEAAIRKAIADAKAQMPNEEVDEAQLEAALLKAAAEPEAIEPSAATPGERGESQGVFAGNYVKESDEGWAKRAKAWVDKWPDLLTAYEKTVSPKQAEAGLTDAIRKYALNEIMERAVAMLKAQKNPVEMAMARQVIEASAKSLQSISSDAGATLSASNLSQRRYSSLLPVLSLFNLINKQHRKLSFPELTDDVLRQWAINTKAKAIQETKKNLSEAAAIVAREFKIAAKELDLIWGEIFRSSLKNQDATKRAIMREILKHPKLQKLSDDGVAELANLLGREWAKAHKAVYRSEFSKLIELPKVSQNKRLKMMNALPRIIMLANVGVLDNAAFRNAIAPAFGMLTFDGDLAKRVIQLSQEAQEFTGKRRDQAVEKIYHEMLKSGGINPWEVLRDWWYGAVLSGFQTTVDDASGILNGGIHTLMMAGMAGRGMPYVFKAYGKGMREALSEFFPMLWRGDMWRSEDFNQEKPETVLEALSESRNLFKKAIGQMKYMRRVKGAIDHLNGLPTQQAAIALLLHRAGMTAELKRMLDPTPDDIRLARERAEAEGTPPEMIRKRVREILQDTVPDEITLEARDIRRMVGYKNTPRGFLGAFYKAISEGEKRIPGAKYFLGTAFVRFAANYGNDYLNYMAPVAAVRWVMSSGRFAGGKHGLQMTPVERELMLVKASLGTVAAVAAAALFLGDDDGKEHDVDITGSFKSLDPTQKNQLLAQGKKPYSIKVGNTYVSYRQFGIGAVLGVVGELRDRQLYQPKKWSKEDILDKFSDAMLSGVLMVRDSSSIAALMQTVGFANAYKYDTGKLREKDIPKYLAGVMGSIIPNVIRDVDAWSDPGLYQANTGGEYFVRAVPFWRREVGDGPQLNVLGEKIEVNRYPWSRWVKSREPDKAWDTLGALAAKGVFMPTPEAVKVTPRNGKRRDMTPAELTRYQKEVGAGFRAFLEKDGSRILRLRDPDKMADAIDDLATPVRRRVLDDINRRAR